MVVHSNDSTPYPKLTPGSNKGLKKKKKKDASRAEMKNKTIGVSHSELKDKIGRGVENHQQSAHNGDQERKGRR